MVPAQSYGDVEHITRPHTALELLARPAILSRSEQAPRILHLTGVPPLLVRVE